MKPAPFRYHRAASLEDAIATLASAGPDDDVRVIAGGQSLGPMLNLRLVRPTVLVDIHRIEALRAIEPLPDGGVRIGACVTHAQLEDLPPGGAFSAANPAVFPAGLADVLRHVAGGIAYRAIRCRGTIGGSLAHADPAADWPSALAALGATIELTGPAGRRNVAARDFCHGLFETAIEPGEVLAAILLPGSGIRRWGRGKHCRKAGEFAHALAVCIDRGGDGVEVWLGATGAAPVAIALDRAFVDGVAGSRASAALRRTRMRERIAASLPAAIAPGDAYARHLHAQVAAEAVIDAMANP
ncbi:MAG: FAD binding domain-containing protein [bacterium]|jgi:carbon-monoxide dehydrogenase medium subunit|nr:FAD binding domain-containing protein [Betaproteobacteria bacterium]